MDAWYSLRNSPKAWEPTPRCWNGPVRAPYSNPLQSKTNNLDNKAYADADLPFEVVVEEFGGEAFYNALKDAAVVLGRPPTLLHPISANAAETWDVPCVNNFEHSLWTRLQINGTNLSGSVRKLKKPRLGARLGATEYCIGSCRDWHSMQTALPAYDAYAKHSASSMLYFDSRTQQDDVISQDDLDDRLQYLDAGNPLRLAFSGRLIPHQGRARFGGHRRSAPAPWHAF